MGYLNLCRFKRFGLVVWDWDSTAVDSVDCLLRHQLQVLALDFHRFERTLLRHSIARCFVNLKFHRSDFRLKRCHHQSFILEGHAHSCLSFVLYLNQMLAFLSEEMLWWLCKDQNHLLRKAVKIFVALQIESRLVSRHWPFYRSCSSFCLKNFNI